LTEKAAVIYDPATNTVLRRFRTIFSKETNIDRLVLSSHNTYACDNKLDLYDACVTGKLVRNLERNNYTSLSLNIEQARFLFSGRYVIASEPDLEKIHVIRCYDSFRVATLKLKSKLTCLRVGEEERTVVLGTQDGNVLALKLLIDLEKLEAVEYIQYYRQNRVGNREASIPKTIRVALTTRDVSSEQRRESLQNDLKRVVHSASAHRQLKFRESQFSSNSAASFDAKLKSGRGSSSGVARINSEFHGGVAKLHLTNVALGLKHTESRACVIQ
jgi:hypothetical protein